MCCNDPFKSAPQASGAGSTHTPKCRGYGGGQGGGSRRPRTLACDSVTCGAHSGNQPRGGDERGGLERSACGAGSQ